MTRVLIVYRKKELLNWASAILRSAGYDVAKAANSRGARLLVRTDFFHALLVEVANPLCDRFELIQSLRRERKELRIIAISAGRKALPSARALIISRALGADAILYRPCLAGELLDVIEAVSAG